MPWSLRAALAGVLLLGLLAAQPQRKAKPVPLNIRVTVAVVDPKGVPVQNAGVVLTQTAVKEGRLPKNLFQVELKTDEKGTADIQGFEPGVVRVQVIAKGFQTWGQAYTVKLADEYVTVKLAPPKPQVSIYH